MLKKLIAVGALTVGVLGFGTIGQASAGTDVNIGIGLGGGYYDPGPVYYGGGQQISCRQGARIVASAGFRRVRPSDCKGSEYKYYAFRRGDMYKITMKSRNGKIKDVDRIHRGGWDDYDDDDYGDY